MPLDRGQRAVIRHPDPERCCVAQAQTPCRGYFKLKQDALAKLFCQAAGIPAGSQPYKDIVDWKKPGSQGSKAVAGQFAEAIREVRFA